MLSFRLNGLGERTVFKFISIKGIELLRGTVAVVLMVLQDREAGGWISGALGQTGEELCYRGSSKALTRARKQIMCSRLPGAASLGLGALV